ncbi:MAG: hypothetical protein J2P24_04795 [Streptosporangiales bacterium]|nr:hypothetical protein [Streptosporangiales bacterium]MBO0892242.1 hypothetical protein [Acidothermales bacterium]
MIKDALKPLREPVAWILLAAVALFFFSGLWDLFNKANAVEGANWFLYNAYFDVSDFANLTVPAVLVAGMLLVTVLPDRTKVARPVVLIAMIESAVMVLFGIMTLILGLFYGSTRFSSVGVGDKGQHVLYYLPMLALTVIPLLVGLVMFRTAELSPPRAQQPPGPPAQAGFYQQPQQQPYPGAPYGGWQGGTPQPQPQQPPPHTYGQGWS